MNKYSTSRRAFLGGTGEALGGLWLAMNWPVIAAAAHHADAATAADAAPALTWLTAEEALDVDALCSCIIPGGDTPGAHEARTVVFIDHALGSFFADRAPDFRQQLGVARSRFAADHDGKVFAQASGDEQAAFMQAIEHSPFFSQLRFLTILGLLSSPKYGGNFQSSGWKLLGFKDEHIFSPPFGFYDRDYPGFTTPLGAAVAGSGT